MDEPVGCARPTGTTVGEKPTSAKEIQTEALKEVKMTARVGQKAPDFGAPAYHQGKFTTVKLADYVGKWVLLCFYPGDFTFV